MSLEQIAHLTGRSDENGSLIISTNAAGTDEARKPTGHVRVTQTVTTSYLKIAEKAEDATIGPFTPAMNVIGRGDGTSLLVGVVAAGVSPGPKQPLGMLRVRTDGQGYLLTSQVAVGALLGPILPLSQVLCRIDETGALRTAIGP